MKRFTSTLLALATSFALLMGVSLTPASAAPAPAKSVVKVVKIKSVPGVALYLRDAHKKDRANFNRLVSPNAKAVKVKNPYPFQKVSATPGLEAYFKATAKRYKSPVAFERNVFACYVDANLSPKQWDASAKRGSSLDKRQRQLSDCINYMIVRYHQYN